MRAHGLRLNRARSHGRTISWRGGCACGWEAPYRRFSRTDAIADHREHQQRAASGTESLPVQRRALPEVTQ